MKKKSSLRFTLSAILLTLSVTGCSSIVSDSSYPVSISSTPDNATFVIKDSSGTVVHRGTTPSSITLDSSDGFFQKAKYTIVFNKEGYQEASHTLTAGLDGWYIGNILFGGFIGMLIVDPATGAMWKLPKAASAELDDLNSDTTDAGLTVMTLSDFPVELQDQLVAL